MDKNKPRICGIITKAFGIKAFMLDNLRYVSENGPFDSYFICERTDEFTADELRSLTYLPIDIRRGNVSPMEVIRCTYRLYKIFRRYKFDIIQFASSNAGLYASIAGWMARIPIRIYCQWGISYTDYTGFRLWFYKLAEKVTCLFATHVQPDSFANLRFAISEGLYKAKKGSVIGKGSATGVDMTKYDVSKAADWRIAIRSRYNIPSDSKVLGFVGRLVPEKGINELFESFLAIADPDVRLLMVGPNYETGRLNQTLWKKAHNDARIIFCGSQSNTAPYYAAMDFLVLPSYREGFGSVVLEAGALKVPTICSDIKGPTDYVKDMTTGLLCEPMSAKSLHNVMSRALKMTPAEYENLATNAYRVVKRDYDAAVFREFYLSNRMKLLQSIK